MSREQVKKERVASHEPSGRARSPQRAAHADNFTMDRAGLRKHLATPLRRRATERPPYRAGLRGMRPNESRMASTLTPPDLR